MQNAKDTFYVTLRDRLAALNPGRTTEVRGALRAGVLVVENELRSPQQSGLDGFLIVWTDLAVESDGPPAVWRRTCEIRYATAGSGELAGMDRGRALSAMDGELHRALEPRCAPAMDFSVVPPAALGTAVFWSTAEFAAAVATGDTLARVATVQVFALEDAGGYQ